MKSLIVLRQNSFDAVEFILNLNLDSSCCFALLLIDNTDGLGNLLGGIVVDCIEKTFNYTTLTRIIFTEDADYSVEVVEVD